MNHINAVDKTPRNRFSDKTQEYLYGVLLNPKQHYIIILEIGCILLLHKGHFLITYRVENGGIKQVAVHILIVHIHSRDVLQRVIE